jgi:hypothetical protein
MSTRARIGLDADLIRNLVNTQATLTMYNLALNNPKILVDGGEDSQGIVSGVNYDRNAGTLSFTAAHFTTFTAIEYPSGGFSAAGPPGCGDRPPSHAPKLFKIETTKDSATLYFSPAGDPVTYYYIAYGYTNGDERFGTSFNQGSSNGVLSYKIGHLAPSTTYYFKIRAGNGCMPGSWSGYIAARTESGFWPKVAKKLPTEAPEPLSFPAPVSEPVVTLTPQPSESPVGYPVVEGRKTEREMDTEREIETENESPESQKGNISFFQKILQFFRRLLKV